MSLFVQQHYFRHNQHSVTNPHEIKGPGKNYKGKSHQRGLKRDRRCETGGKEAKHIKVK